ncbi:5-formyltetrahydrofolate cyclo-ligase [Corynebacterium sp. MSK041]|uniref:5-formyltetrahydrofolate cyclo-ligase n=1 Tax=Corynebacterium sp. MSK041 TaxID=3050194 RepID=UPI00254FFACD|nr:5-formyltetrahydrofolate cyclo-ligase [Corynebacterium sp. MSK041]MDK8795088.1 5-formyltetrahydrofolate cyclo-ligase [Corynebacterium sp. MSK041]
MESKSAVRAATRAAREALEQKMLIDASLVTHLLSHLRTLSPRRVAAYSPMPTEPGGAVLLPALAEEGFEVLLPVTLAGGELHWAVYTPGELTPGEFYDIAEPAGPRLPSSVLSTCDVIILPALGVDRTGVRLGQGAGYYDRALLYAPNQPRIALVYDDEVHESLPSDPHDQPVHTAVTPSGVLAFRPY